MFTPKKETVYFALNEGGLGDQIARMSAFEYALKEYPWLDIRIVVPNYIRSLYSHHFPSIKLYTFDEMSKINRKIPITLINADISQCTIIRQHLVKHAFNTLLDISPIDETAFNYIKLNLTNINISKFNLPEKYVILTNMSTVDVRSIPSRILLGIEEFLINQNITPVLLGKSQTNVTKNSQIIAEGSAGKYSIDLLNKTSLLEAAKIMSNAICVVGVDNGLLHLAATTDVPIISGFTTVHPKHRIPMRNNLDGWKYKSIIPNVSCRFCQSRYNFVFEQDFRKCVDNTLDCVKQMTIMPWISALVDIFSNNYGRTIYEDCSEN